MAKFRLQRVLDNHLGTIGSLILNDKIIATTLERPWRDNEPFESCIPCGVYRLSKWNSGKFGDCAKVLDVQGRTNILFHAGNDINDTKGCILLGNGLDIQSDKPFILDSKYTMDVFLKLLDEQNKLWVTY